MDQILQELLVACYLDDILIATKTEEDDDTLLKQMLERLESAATKLRLENVNFI